MAKDETTSCPSRLRRAKPVIITLAAVLVIALCAILPQAVLRVQDVGLVGGYHTVTPQGGRLTFEDPYELSAVLKLANNIEEAEILGEDGHTVEEHALALPMDDAQYDQIATLAKTGALGISALEALESLANSADGTGIVGDFSGTQLSYYLWDSEEAGVTIGYWLDNASGKIIAVRFHAWYDMRDAGTAPLDMLLAYIDWLGLADVQDWEFEYDSGMAIGTSELLGLRLRAMCVYYPYSNDSNVSLTGWNLG